MTADQASVFAANLRRLKDEQDKSWRDIADALGHRNDRYVKALGAGQYEPRQETARKIAAFFGVTVASMLEDS